MTSLLRKSRWWRGGGARKTTSARSCSSISPRRWRNAAPTGCRRTRPDGPRGATWATSRSCARKHELVVVGLVEQLAQDVRYGLRGMVKHRTFTVLAALSLALGIGANTAIYSFMDSILLRSLPVSDPASLIVVKWRSKPTVRSGRQFVLHSIDGSTFDDPRDDGSYLPVSRIRTAARGVGAIPLQPLCAKPAGSLNVIIKGEAELAQGEYVSGDFFRGLAVLPAAGRLIAVEDDRVGATPVAVLSLGIQPAPLRRPTVPSGRRCRSTTCRSPSSGSRPPSSSASIRQRLRTSICRCTPASSGAAGMRRHLSTRTTTGSK